MLRAGGPAGNPPDEGFDGRVRALRLRAMSERARRRCRERLQDLAGAGLDAEDARRAAIGELRRAVGFERWCWPLSDPASAVSVSGLGEVDFWPALPRLVALEHGGDVTSKPRLLAGGGASVSLSAATGGDLPRSRRWRECLAPYGIGDELMTACRDRHGCWGTVELMRDAADPPFGEADRELLEAVAPTLGTLLRRGLARGGRAEALAGEPRPPGTLILDAELRPVSWTPPWREWLPELPAPGPGLLPPAVFEIGARALEPPGALPNRVRMRTTGGRWAALEGARLEGGPPGVAVTVRAASAEETFDLLCRVHDLSPRERQLAALVVAGLATDQLARALYISPYTVKDHLKAIFAKTGAGTRGELVSQLTGAA
jgi:DNA-binding CsgD family transcriptional regulator